MQILTQKLVVKLEHVGEITIQPSDFITVGGEAAIYRLQDMIIKIYLDEDKITRDSMLDKIRLLSSLPKYPGIIAPYGIVSEKRTKKAIGFYMPFVDGEPLPRIFTNSFWQRSSFNFDLAKQLVDKMRSTMIFAHKQKAIIVDPNEGNWAVNSPNTHPEPKIFDMDSWAIGRWKPSVIVPSIRDWHTSGFTELSDWFSWGIITFQVFSGIHPYRGTLSGYGIQLNDLEKRMKDNLSVFTQGVRLNRAVRDFNEIPRSLLDWYQSVFQKAERTEPPSPFDKGISLVTNAALVQRTILTTNQSMKFKKLFQKIDDQVIRIFPCGIVQTRSGSLYDLSSTNKIGSFKGDTEHNPGEVIEINQGWIIAEWNNNTPVLTFVDKNSKQEKRLPFQLTGNRYFRFENRLFIVAESKLHELDFLYVNRVIVSVRNSIDILHFNSTQWFDSVGVQEAFDAKFLILPFGDKSITTCRTKELDSVRIINAKAGARFVTIIGLDKTGLYQKFEFTFSANYTSYTVLQEVVESPNLNVTILPKMVCAKIIDDGEIIIFVPVNGNVTKMKDKYISTNMALANWHNAVVYVDNGAVWQISSS